MMRAVLMACVRAYRLFVSPWLPAACRFTPSCSAYALQALQQHGAAAGTYLTAKRVLRCHPGCAAGHDPVPAKPPRVLRRLALALQFKTPHE